VVIRGRTLRPFQIAVPRHESRRGCHHTLWIVVEQGVAVCDPVGFLERLGGFIGVGAMPDRVRELAVERVNSSARDLPIPAAVERHVAERFAGQAEIMARLAGGPAIDWLERIRNIARVKHA